MSDPKVFDADGQEQDWAWLDCRYGTGYERADVPAGQLVYRLVSADERVDGSHSCITQVLNQAGLPIEGANVALWWIGAPDPPEPGTTVNANDWYPNFVHGDTNVNGDVGPGLGGGAWADVNLSTGCVILDKSQDMPHAVWVRDPNIPSDKCTRLCMRGGSNHWHVNQKFQLFVAGSPQDPANGGAPPVEGLEIKEYLVEENTPANMLYIAYPDELSVETDVHAVCVDISDDLDTTELEEWQHNDTRYARGGVCTDYAGGDPNATRIFQLWAYHLPYPDNRFTPIAEYEFQPLGSGDKKTVTAVVDYVEEPEPPQPPEPPEPPEPPTGWTMTIDDKPSPGKRWLIGHMPRNGITIVVTDPWGNFATVESGSKSPEYDPVGAWLVAAWAGNVTFTVSFLGANFGVVPPENTTLHLYFIEGQPPEPPEPPPPEGMVHLESPPMPPDEANAKLQALQSAGFDYFFVVEE